MTPAFALFAAFTVAATDARLLEAQKFLEAGDCEGLEALCKKTGPTELARDLAYARVLVQAAGGCRTKDKVLALNLTEKAAELAPADYGVETAQAESLIATEQRTEGAKLLDQVIEKFPGTALRARLLRAELANNERDWAIAAQVARPLTGDPEYGKRATALVALAEHNLQENGGEKARLALEEQQVRDNGDKAAAIATSHTVTKGSEASGYEVWSGKTAKVVHGGSKTFSTKNLKAGSSYVFVATGTCEKPKVAKASRGGRSKKKSHRQEPLTNDFGVSFKVYIGALEPLALDTDLGVHKRNSLLFRPLEDNPQIRVQDETDSKINVKCSITDIGVRVP